MDKGPTRKFKRKGSSRRQSEYGKHLKEKQKLRDVYGLRDEKLEKYVKKAASQEEQSFDRALISMLERRLDNVVFRLGFAKTRAQSRQFVNHEHILVNSEKRSRPGFEVTKDDSIKVREDAQDMYPFRHLETKLQNQELPVWLALDRDNLVGEVKREPNLDDFNADINLSLITEFYNI